MTRSLSRLMWLLLLGGTLVAAGVAPAHAQGFGWFGGLFGGGGGGGPYQQRQGPAYPGYGDGQDASPYAPRHRPRRRQVQQTPRAPREATQAPAKEKAPPKNASTFVYVFGDGLGQYLANGLDDALADRQDVAVVHKGSGSSGLVQTDHYDWPKAIDALLAGKDKIDVAVMMIGSNDRQPITADGTTYAVGSDDWNAAYKKRVLAIDEAFHKKGVPLIWVGVPITKNSDFADSMAAFNDIYRDAAAKTGATYVDTWEAFSDDNGDFDAFGPDVDGQPARLRSADGIYFTKAGARKLAHFVEAPIRRILDGKAPAPALPAATAPDAKLSASKGPDDKEDGGKAGADKAPPRPVAVVKPEAGPVNSLNDPPSAPDGQLVDPNLSATDRLVKGEPAAAPTGRADDARWSANGQKGP